MKEEILIIPFSTVFIGGLILFFTGLGQIYSIKAWFKENLTTIIIVAGIIVTIVAILLWVARNFLAALSSLFGASQLLFFIIYGGMNLYDGEGFGIIWACIVFFAYFVVAFLNVLGYLFSNLSFFIAEEGNDIGIVFNLIYGVVGWIINLIIVWAILTS